MTSGRLDIAAGAGRGTHFRESRPAGVPAYDGISSEPPGDRGRLATRARLRGARARRRARASLARAAAETGALEDRPPVGAAVHRLLAWEEQAILELIEQWGWVNRSH